MAMKFKSEVSSDKASFGKAFLASVVSHQDIYSLVGKGDISKLFTEPELPAFYFMLQFAKKHAKIPEVQTIAQNTGVDLPAVPENPSYYRELLERRFVERRLKKAVIDSQEFFGDANKNPESAIAVLQTAMTEIARLKFSQNLIDYREAGSLLLQTYADTVTSKSDTGLLTGWPTYDKMSGGLMKGDYLSVIGRPMAGKSWLMIWIALSCWWKGETILLVSMEMSALYILQRLSAIDSGISLNHIKKDGLTTKELGKFKDTMNAAATAPNGFYVVDGNLSSTVEQIAALSSAVGATVTLVDGGYLCKHPTIKDRFVRVAENAELFKTEVASKTPLAVSWQFARLEKGSKKTKADAKDASLDDIGYTDAIAQVSSTVLGLMQHETIETLNRKRVKILKGRAGEVGEFEIKWDFNKMDFSELVEQDIGELQYV